ncbi:MAG: hypothetical protein V7754_12325 [Halioglobus sp.]
MAIALLDINDSNLQLWHGDQQLQSPGYALLDGKQYRFGSGARAAARLSPRQINTRFWWQLDTQALQPALGPARHTADLVHAHLLDIYQAGGKPEEILLSVSGSIDRDQLALVLGIIGQCPFNAVGLVNRSVALGSLYGGPGKLFHLEIQLHQAVISELAESGGKVELKRTIPLPGCGLLQLQERLVEIIATAFIRQTRFDPRRKADTEQMLYDALPTTLRELQTVSETNLEVNGYRARIAGAELETAGSRLFSSAPDAMGVLSPSDRVILDPLATLLPGLHSHIPQAHVIANDAMPTALNQHMDQLVQRNETLNFITALPCLTEKITPSDIDQQLIIETPAPPLPAPTHWLQGATARPLQASGTTLEHGLELFAEGGIWCLRPGSDTPPQVNGAAYRDGTALRPGDSLTSSTGITTVLIEIQP